VQPGGHPADAGGRQEPARGSHGRVAAYALRPPRPTQVPVVVTAGQEVGEGELLDHRLAQVSLAWFTRLNRLGVDRADLFVGILPMSTLVSTAVVDGRWPSAIRTAGVALVAAGLAIGLARSRTGWRVNRSAGSPASVAASGSAP
jgi:hypothetical protein